VLDASSVSSTSVSAMGAKTAALIKRLGGVCTERSTCGTHTVSGPAPPCCSALLAYHLFMVSKHGTVSSAQAKAEVDARTESRARAMLDEAASLAPASTNGDAELADQLSEKARVAWTKNGLLIPSTKLAEEWGITRGALDQAEEGYEVFLLKIRGWLWAPAVFAKLKRSAVAKVCRTMPSADEVSKLFFWMQPHGALGRKTPAQAIQAGQLERVLEIARGLAEENGWAHAEAA